MKQWIEPRLINPLGDRTIGILVNKNRPKRRGSILLGNFDC